MRSLALTACVVCLGCGSRSALEVETTAQCLPALGSSEVWVRQLPLTGTAYAEDVAAGPSGEVVWLGSHEGTVDFGCGPLAAGELGSLVVVKLDRFGNLQWQRALRDRLVDAHLDVDAAGNVYVAEHVQMGAPEDLELFVWKLSPSGNVIWEWSLPQPSQVKQLIELDATADGSVLVAISEPGGGVEAVHARAFAFTAKGDLVGQLSILPVQGPLDRSAVVSNVRWLDGDVVTAGVTPFAETGPFGIEELFVARFGLDGSVRWWQSWPRTETSSHVRLLGVSGGDAFIQRWLGASLECVRFRGTDGAELESHALGVTFGLPRDALVTSDGGFEVAFTVEEDGPVGTLPLTVTTAPDVAVAAWSAAGELEHAAIWGGPGNQGANALAESADFRLVTGSFDQTLEIPGVGAIDAYLDCTDCGQAWLARVPGRPTP